MLFPTRPICTIALALLLSHTPGVFGSTSTLMNYNNAARGRAEGAWHCAACKQQFCHINNSDCHWELLQLKQMFHVDKQGLGKEFLSHCSFFSVPTTDTWQQLLQYSCLLQANLFNPGSEVSFHKSNSALDEWQSQGTLGGNGPPTSHPKERRWADCA